MKLILLAFLGILSCHLFAADTKLPDWAQVANGKETNYLGEILAGDQITNAIERTFLQALAVNEKSNSLAKVLGYVTKQDYHEFGSVQYPGKKAEPTYADYGNIEIQFQRMQLKFHATAQDSNRHILVFARFTGWPGMNNTCVVLTDGKFGVLDWCESKQSDVCESATYDRTKERLTVKCEHRQGGTVEYRYDLKDDKVTLRQSDDSKIR